jgi:glycosyltransferase involved in cell wall biosynthesis
MNFGLPIITTDQVGAGYDLVKDGENGFVYPVGDIEKLANCLLRLFQNPELKERMGKYSSEIISRWSYNEGEEGILNALEYIKKQKF